MGPPRPYSTRPTLAPPSVGLRRGAGLRPAVPGRPKTPLTLAARAPTGRAPRPSTADRRARCAATVGLLRWSAVERSSKSVAGRSGFRDIRILRVVRASEIFRGVALTRPASSVLPSVLSSGVLPAPSLAGASWGKTWSVNQLAAFFSLLSWRGCGLLQVQLLPRRSATVGSASAPARMTTSPSRAAASTRRR